MSELFLRIVNMSIAASWIVLAILVLRSLLKKAPKWISVLLWGLVAIRLICPFSIESMFSLIPSAETVSPDIMLNKTPQINSGIPMINNAVNPVIDSSLSPAPGDSANPLQIWIPILSVVWIAGMVVLIAYMAISCLRVRNQVKTAVLFLKDNIYECETVTSPFVLGIIKPKIYLPFGMSAQNASHVIAHEQAHIRRHDHLWKPIGFLLLTLHWFNPLLWLGYILLCRDIEFACDEKVIKELSCEARVNYSEALLCCSIGRRTIVACPLAFGEVGVKERIKTVLNYKKPTFWLVIVAIVALIAASVCLLTNPKGKPLKEMEYTSIAAYCEDTADIMVGDGEHFQEIADFDQELLDSLFNLSISKHEISKNRSENRDKTHTLILHDSNDYSLYILSGVVLEYHELGIKIHFNENFTEVWMNDGVKPTFSHKVLEPETARELYEMLGQNTNIPPKDIVVLPQTENVDKLRIKYPMYFDLPTENGLNLYIWQMAENSYSCGLLPSKNYTQKELFDLHTAPASLEEMRLIVASYFPDIQRHNLNIIPITMPHSSYAYDIDEEYTKSVTALFWSYSIPILDAIVCDIDDDGKDEYCYIGLGPTSGLFTFTVTIVENGVEEYKNIFNTRWYDLSFTGVNGKVVVQGITKASMKEPAETHLFEISFKDGHVVLTRLDNPDETLPYWGK